MDEPADYRTVGILYTGEMGTSLGNVFREAGLRVVTVTEGRSLRTRRFCHEAGFSVLPSLGEVIDHSDIVISLVSPGAALSVAKSVAAHRKRRSHRLIYVDANSISPPTVSDISEVLHPASFDFVDASIFGLASQLKERGVLYFSGSRSEDLSDRFGSFLRVKVLGTAPGQASALKMVVSGIPKGLCALFMETMLLAQEMHLLNEAIEACDDIYPSIMEVIKRMLPTYPQHAARRCEELQAVEETMLINNLTPRIVRAVREVTSDLASGRWNDDSYDLHYWTIAEVIQRIQQQKMLQPSGFLSADAPRGKAACCPDAG